MTKTIALTLLLAASALASAAPPNHDKTAPPADPAPTDLDVDAMARAKDVGATPPADATSPTDESATSVEPPADAAPPAEEGAPAEPEAAAAPAAPAPAESAPDEDTAVAKSCRAHATRLLDNLQKSDFDAATGDFDAKMKSALPPDKLKDAWDSLARFGKLDARGQSHLGNGQGYTIVMIPLIFEKADLVAQVACGSDGRVAGFHVTPIPKPDS